MPEELRLTSRSKHSLVFRRRHLINFLSRDMHRLAPTCTRLRITGESSVTWR